MKRIEICGLHCPKITLGLFLLHGIWFTIAPLGVPTYGNFWSWIVLLSGICTLICTLSKVHQKTICPFVGINPLVGIAAIAVGIWFLLADLNIVTTFGISLLHISYLIIIIGALTHKKGIC